MPEPKAFSRGSRPNERLSAGWINHQGSRRGIPHINQRVRVIRTAHNPRFACRSRIWITSRRRLAVISLAITILDDRTNQRSRGRTGRGADRRTPHIAAGNPTNDCATGRTVTRSLSNRCLT